MLEFIEQLDEFRVECFQTSDSTFFHLLVITNWIPSYSYAINNL